MSFEITVPMVEQFSSNVRMLGEQTQDILRPICEVKSVVGKTFYGDSLKGSEAVTKSERHGTNPFTPVRHGRRRGTIIDKHWGDYLDEADAPKVIIDFKGKYVQLGVQALNRTEEDLIIEALGGAAYSVPSVGDGAAVTINNYDAGECRILKGDGTLATAGSDASDTTETALTIAKLGLVGELLDEAQLPPELTRYFIANAYNKWQLLQTTEVKSSDYNTVKALANGAIDTFMGFKFLWTERLKVHATDTGCIRAYACVQGAIALGVGQETRGRMWQDGSHCNSWYCYCDSSKGATRQEGPAVIEILLKKAA
jgi:hypothetical protein